MKRKMPSPTFVEYAVLALFLGVVAFGVYYVGSPFMKKNAPAASPVGTGAPQAPSRIAPTAAQYEAEVRTVMAPFLEQAQKMTPADFASDNAAMLQLVIKTQDRMGNTPDKMSEVIVVPKEYMNAHFSFVLLLAKWRSALEGSVADQKTIHQKTLDVMAANPWLTAPSAAPAK